MKKFAMLVAAPVSLIPEAIIAPKIIKTPMPVIVEPKYFLIKSMVPGRLCPVHNPIRVATRNNVITG